MLDPGVVSAVILGGGDGQRMGGRAKAFLRLGGETLLERAVSVLGPYCGQVVVGVPASLVDEARSLLGILASIYEGGATRQETFEKTLRHADRDFVLIHDVARPMLAEALIESVLEAADQYGSAVPVVRHRGRDSLALESDGFLAAPVDRDQLVGIQTPYIFRRKVLIEALDAARADGVVENSLTTLVTRIGERAHVVDGDEGNFKITFPEDWESVQTKFMQSGA